MGVLLSRVGATDWNNLYLHSRLTEAALCPGERCPIPTFFDLVHGGTSSGNGYFILRAGTYSLTLLGDPGETINASLRFAGLAPGTLSITTPTSHVAVPSRLFSPLLTVVGHDLESRGYEDNVGGRRLNVLMLGFVVDTPGVASYGWCDTTGPSAPSARRQAALICHGGGVGPLGPFLLIDVGSTAYGLAYYILSVNDGYAGVGYDVAAVASGARLVAEWFSVPA